jgi:hypothetical protein
LYIVNCQPLARKSYVLVVLYVKSTKTTRFGSTWKYKPIIQPKASALAGSHYLVSCSLERVYDYAIFTICEQTFAVCMPRRLNELCFSMTDLNWGAWWGHPRVGHEVADFEGRFW